MPRTEYINLQIRGKFACNSESKELQGIKLHNKMLLFHLNISLVLVTPSDRHQENAALDYHPLSPSVLHYWG